jgi:hypothetical protein
MTRASYDEKVNLLVDSERYKAGQNLVTCRMQLTGLS